MSVPGTKVRPRSNGDGPPELAKAPAPLLQGRLGIAPDTGLCATLGEAEEPVLQRHGAGQSAHLRLVDVPGEYMRRPPQERPRTNESMTT